MTSLSSLNLSLNKLEKFPSLPKGAALNEVTLSVNRISVLPPDSLKGLDGLTSLHISENSLASLPLAITSLTQLQRLDCSDNNLTSIPYSMGHMNLSQINLQGNILTDLKPEVLTKSTGQILAYLVSKIPVVRECD